MKIDLDELQRVAAEALESGDHDEFREIVTPELVLSIVGTIRGFVARAGLTPEQPE